MSSLALNTNEFEEPQASKVWFEEDQICAELVDGRTISVPLSFYPLLMDATKEEREDFRLFGDGTAIHFNSLDEDLSIEALVMGRKQLPGLAK
jgi:hypothetical protein